MLGVELEPQLSSQSQKQRHQKPGRCALLHEMFCELFFVMAPTTITESPVSVDGLLTQLIGQRTELLNERGGGLDQHHPRVWHCEAGLCYWAKFWQHKQS
jgi:hypothetical protein